ncbi:hypothetical protein KPA96_19530 [Burkholderia cenocepacia]|uniref:hypothetical protein n=1 Tax=Burkholderia cenocepacia TaxID=95486 RepID=UPI00285BCCF3|nr:hypothetical protein [Burkholderia cenocepacia]MDR8077849.1 hypothetical protein [Burkholderia cenocepacia]
MFDSMAQSPTGLRAMTVASDVQDVTHDTDGVTVVFPIPFYFLRDADVRADRIDALGVAVPLVFGTDFTLTGAGNPAGGSLTTVNVIAAGYKLHIYRDVPATQETQFQQNDPFPSKTTERALDKLTMLSQRAFGLISTGIRYPFSEFGTNAVLPAAAARGGKALVFKSTGEVGISLQNWKEPQTILDEAKATAEAIAAGIAPGSGTGTFIQDGAGAVVRTFQSKMREPVSVKDFGGVGAGADESSAFSLAAAKVGPNGQVSVPAGNWRIETTPTTPITWLVDAQATFTGAGALSGRIIKFGNNGAHSKGTKFGAQSAWLESLRPFTESIAEVAVVSTIGQIGIIGASRTSDFGVAGSQGCIGVSGYANNDNTTQLQTGYGGYFEARRQVGAGITQAVEIDIVNFGSVGVVYPGNVYAPDLTSCLWLASGGDIAGAQGASLALGIIANGAPFDKGIVIQTGAVTPYFGEAVAIALGSQNGIVWYDGGTNKIARIRSDATAPSIGLIFANNRLAFQDMSTNPVLTLQDNGILNIEKGTGGLYFVGTQVISARQVGWHGATGPSRAALNASTATLSQVAAAVAALIIDLTTHGLIGA